MTLAEARKIIPTEEINDNDLQALINALSGVVNSVLDEYLGLNEF